MDAQIINKKEIIINDKKIQEKKSDKLSNIRLITFVGALVFDILALILKELEIAYDALKREFNLMRSTYG